MPTMPHIELLDRRIDSVFKRIFGDQDHPAPLIDLLNAIFSAFNQPTITALEILNPTLEPDMCGDKTAILDIRARSEDGRMLNVEMQMVNSGNFIHRTLYYWAELYGESLHAGDDYRTLNRTITINLLNFKLFARERLISLYQLRDSGDQDLLTDLMQVYFIELPKLNQQPMPPRLQQWLRFITIDDSNELKALADVNPAIGEAYHMLNYISQDSEERLRHIRRKIALMDQKALERNATEAKERLDVAEANLKEVEEAIKQIEEKARLAEQQTLQAQQQAIQAEQQTLQAQQQAHQAEQQALQAEQQALQAEQQALQAEQQALQAEQHALQAEQQALQAENRANLLEQQTKQVEKIAELEKQVANQRLEKARSTLLALARRVLTQRFGALPEWAETQLAAASLEQLEELSERASDATELEHCFQ